MQLGLRPSAIQPWVMILVGFAGFMYTFRSVLNLIGTPLGKCLKEI